MRDEEELIEKAYDAYFKEVDKITFGMGSANQPSRRDTVVGRKYVYLYNINGLLAKYVIKTGEIIW